MLPVYYQDNPLGAYGFPGPGLPDLVGNHKPANQSASNWINQDAIEAPTTLRFVNEPERMTHLCEGGTINVDFSLSNGFDITERFKTQFLAEFLNAFNHP